MMCYGFLKFVFCFHPRSYKSKYFLEIKINIQVWVAYTASIRTPKFVHVRMLHVAINAIFFFHLESLNYDALFMLLYFNANKKNIHCIYKNKKRSQMRADCLNREWNFPRNSADFCGIPWDQIKSGEKPESLYGGRGVISGTTLPTRMVHLSRFSEFY